jgi:hypothetical protein
MRTSASAILILQLPVVRADFTLNSFGLTYENSGLADIACEIDDMSLIGTRSKAN